MTDKELKAKEKKALEDILAAEGKPPRLGCGWLFTGAIIILILGLFLVNSVDPDQGRLAVQVTAVAQDQVDTPTLKPTATDTAVATPSLAPTATARSADTAVPEAAPVVVVTVLVPTQPATPTAVLTLKPTDTAVPTASWTPSPSPSPTATRLAPVALPVTAVDAGPWWLDWKVLTPLAGALITGLGFLFLAFLFWMSRRPSQNQVVIHNHPTPVTTSPVATQPAILKPQPGHSYFHPSPPNWAEDTRPDNRPSQVVEPVEPVEPGASQPFYVVDLPFPTDREPTALEAEFIRLRYNQLGSKNAVINDLYGGKKGQKTLGWINDALTQVSPYPSAVRIATREGGVIHGRVVSVGGG